jgi:general secretion pathway protein I
MVHHKSDGMSLIEVLVAFVILSMAMSVILRINATTLSNHQVTTDYFKAVQVAQSRLEQMATDRKNANLNEQGSEQGGFRWRYLRWPHSGRVDEKRLALPIVPVKETITISWDSSAGERRLMFSRIGLVYEKP